jgi:hypothetical protein
MSASNSSTGDSADGESSEGDESTAPRGNGGGLPRRAPDADDGG